MTKEKRHLWYDFLRAYPVRFLRQKILGQYIADFYCASAKLVIELYGSQHFEEEHLQKDARRTHFLEGYDIVVLRFANNEITKNFEGVCQKIDQAVKERLMML